MKDYLLTLIQQYGAAGLFIFLILEFIGLPIPGEPLMSFMGYNSWKLGGNIYTSIIAAAAGSFTGSMLAYFIGFRYGEAVVLKLGRHLNITEKKLESMKEVFEKHRVQLLIFSRYIPGIRHIVPYLAGTSGLEYKTYIFYNIISSILWTTSFLVLGYFLGEKWTMLETLTKTYSLMILILIAFTFVVYKYFNKHKTAIFAIVLPMLSFVGLSEELLEQELSVFDQVIYSYVSRFISADMTRVMKAASFMGSGPALAAVTILILLVLRRNKALVAYQILIPINLIISSLINIAFKLVFHRQRPSILKLAEATGFSFPSGHSMVSLSFYGFLIFIIYANMKSRWKYLICALLSFLIILIGISRVYLGVHYGSDVLAGFFAALAWLAIFITLSRRLVSKENK